MRIARPVLLVAAAALVVAGGSAGADGGHDDDAESRHQSHGEDLAASWAALQEARDVIAAHVEAGRLDQVHEASEPLPALAKAVIEHSQGLEASKRRRVEGALGQLSKVSDALHEAADAGKTEAVLRQLVRLDSLLKLARAQYPAGALDTGAVRGHGEHGAHGSGHGKGAGLGSQQRGGRLCLIT